MIGNRIGIAYDMELFPPHPDLSLQISPPNHSQEMGFCRSSGTNMDLSLAPGHECHDQTIIHKQDVWHSDVTMLKPIRGIPVYRHPPTFFPFLHQNQASTHRHILARSSNNISSSSSSSSGGGGTGPRFFSRFPARRSMGTPRMRWTTTLHARFVHVVQLLGGHESGFRSPPPSLLPSSRSPSTTTFADNCSLCLKGQHRNQFWSSWM